MSICSTVAKGCTIITITAAMLFGATAQAATNSTNMTVQLNVQTNCNIAVDGPLDFGAVSTTRIAANLDVETTLTVNCSAGVRYALSINNGNNPDGANRRMVGTTNATEYVNYEIYNEPSHASVWGTSSGMVTQNGTGADQSVKVYGRVPPQATPLADRYTDTVAVTITY